MQNNRQVQPCLPGELLENRCEARYSDAWEYLLEKRMWVWLLVFLSTLMMAHAQSSRTGPRERLWFDAGWRFKKDDPSGTGLKSADLLPRLLPTSNPFIKDASQRHARPEDTFGADLPYVSPS